MPATTTLAVAVLTTRRAFLRAAIAAPLAASTWSLHRELATQLPTSYPGLLAWKAVNQSAALNSDWWATIPTYGGNAANAFPALKFWIQEGRLAYREIPAAEWYA